MIARNTQGTFAGGVSLAVSQAIKTTHQLEGPPCRARLGHLEEHQLRRSERVDVLQGHRCNDRGHEAAPQNLAIVGERIELFQPE